ncbi:interleukin-15 [Grus americana]|uniref:interleukin-15 n=1 Tax=Grus americana TaxID=9117 RepID=UPI0024087FAE|nr:interleukin-15 [Grus americana]
MYLNTNCSLVQSSSFHKTRKTHLKSICLQYQLYLLLNSHFFCLLKNEMRLIIIFLCAYVPKTAAGHCKWTEVLKDLEQIKASKDIDVSLYTANTDEDKECQEPVIRCFFLETEVILQECRIKNCSKTQDVLNIWKNGNASLENNKERGSRVVRAIVKTATSIKGLPRGGRRAFAHRHRTRDVDSPETDLRDAVDPRRAFVHGTLWTRVVVRRRRTSDLDPFPHRDTVDPWR